MTVPVVTVVGAGVAGLSAAIALASRGASVQVLERAGELGEVGGGLQIGPNGLAVIRALGLDARMRAVSLPARSVTLLDESGRKVLTLDFARHGHGRRWAVVQRARLIKLMARRAQELGAELRLGREVLRVDNGVPAQLHCRKGSFSAPGLVVGSDGLHGVVRAALGPARPAEFSGQIAWRAVVPDEPAEVADVEVHMGAGRHLVTYPLQGGLRNIVAVEERAAWAVESWSERGDPEALRLAFSGFGPRVTSLIRRVEHAYIWGLFRHPVEPVWHGRRLVLVGDAAHPTLPFLAQGANLALEDAWALAEEVARQPLERALPAYQARRRPRAVRTVAAATRNAWNYHLPPGPLRWAAHQALRLSESLMPGAALRRFDWLYGHDETQSG